MSKKRTAARSADKRKTRRQRRSRGGGATGVDRWDVTHIFAVQNAGEADLVISNLVTSCGCTRAELSSSVIPPGQRADLTVTFDANFHPTQGEVTRLVWFATNDPTQPWVEVRVTADVR